MDVSLDESAPTMRMFHCGREDRGMDMSAPNNEDILLGAGGEEDRGMGRSAPHKEDILLGGRGCGHGQARLLS